MLAHIWVWRCLDPSSKLFRMAPLKDSRRIFGMKHRMRQYFRGYISQCTQSRPSVDWRGVKTNRSFLGAKRFGKIRPDSPKDSDGNSKLINCSSTSRAHTRPSWECPWSLPDSELCPVEDMSRDNPEHFSFEYRLMASLYLKLARENQYGMKIGLLKGTHIVVFSVKTPNAIIAFVFPVPTFASYWTPVWSILCDFMNKNLFHNYSLFRRG